MRTIRLTILAVLTVALAYGESASAQGRGASAQATPAQANTPTKGWYAGGAIGYGGYNATYSRTHETIASTGASAWSVDNDTKDTMWKAYVGYRFTPYVSVEGGYWDFGRPSYSAAIVSPVVTSMNRTFKAQGVGGDAALWLPLRAVSPVLSKVSGFAKLGAMYTRTTASAAAPGGGLTPLPAESSHDLRPHWAVGAEYSIQRNLAARLEFEGVTQVGDDSKFGTADIQMLSIGANYRF